MASDDGQMPKKSLSISLGKEIDAALGDAIRGLLVKPSTELGNLMADGIGIFADRVRRKREANTQIGLEAVRGELEARGVQLKDITPPSEEDLYVVLDGMSVTSDDQIRKLWSGLLALALDPSETNRIERPFTSAISSLSPADARVIEYAAFVMKNETLIRNDAMKAAGLENERNWTVGDARRVEEARQAMGDRLAEYMEAASSMEKSFDLMGISALTDWSDNLLRLGIIQPKPEEYSPQTPRFVGFRGEAGDGKFEAIIEHLENRVQDAEGLALEGLKIGFLFKRDDKAQRIVLGFEFSSFGKKLCKACGIV